MMPHEPVTLSTADQVLLFSANRTTVALSERVSKSDVPAEVAAEVYRLASMVGQIAEHAGVASL